MKEYLIDPEIFNRNLSLKAIGLYIFERYIKKSKRIAFFDVRKDFRDGPTAITSAFKELEKNNLGYCNNSVEPKTFMLNSEILNKKNVAIKDSEIYNYPNIRLKVLGMFFYLYHLSLNKGEYCEELECFVTDNLSLTNISDALKKEGRVSIKNKIQRLSELFYISRYPIYKEGKVFKWRLLLSLKEKDFSVLTASIRENPTAVFVANLNEKSVNFIEPTLKIETLYYMKYIKKGKEERIKMFADQQLQDFSIIFN